MDYKFLRDQRIAAAQLAANRRWATRLAAQEATENARKAALDPEGRREIDALLMQLDAAKLSIADGLHVRALAEMRSAVYMLVSISRR